MPSYTYETVQESRGLPARFELVEMNPLTITTHWHEYLEILFLISGKMTAIIQGDFYEPSPGDILIINSEDIHMTQTYGENTRYVLLQISARQLSQFFPDFKSLRFSTLISGKNTTAESAHHPEKYLNELLRIYKEKTDGYPLLFTARLYELLYCLYTRFSCRSTVPVSDHQNFSRIIRIMNWIDQNYRKSLTLDAAADFLGLSREYFCRVFKKYTGQTFLEYLNAIRVGKLYQELQSSDDSITILMEKHGITNYKIFLRTFKKLYGTTPQHLRKKELHLEQLHSYRDRS